MRQLLLFPEESEAFAPRLYSRDDFLLLPGWPSMENPLNVASVLALNPEHCRFDCLGWLSKEKPRLYEKVLTFLRANGVKTEP